MQNPSHGVVQPLQNHVHLISNHRFPLIASLSLDQAFRYLVELPQVVKQIAPMSWTYVQAPQDGTLWLEWLSQDRSDNRFPSDGYAWADHEQTYRQEFGGYTIEMMAQTVGFRPNYDHMASHARTRYHLIAKNPSVNAANPDASLWLVHYHQTEAHRILPTSQIPLNPQMTQLMNERRWLETQGKLERKDFMLHDRMQWPTINVPNAGYMRQPSVYGAQANVSMRQPINAFPQQPPNKKQRLSASLHHMPSVSDAVHDTSIEDEENTALGDFFDHLTPRDISMARYTQHHRWMEEVFSSPYASSQIVPTDLGLGLMGELKGLTVGILELPSLDFTGRQGDNVPRAKEPQPFTNMSKGQIEEFSERVTKHLEEGQAEIDRMKAEHAAKMTEWKKTKTLMQADRRLRFATWEGHESAVPIYHLDDSNINGRAEENASKETVEDVIKDVERQFGVTVISHKEADMIAQGGLEKEEDRSQFEAIQGGLVDDRQQVLRQEREQSDAVNGEGEAPIYHQQPASVAQAKTRELETSMQPDSQQPNISSEQHRYQQSQATHPAQFARSDPAGNVSSIGMDDGINDTSMMEGMDIDVDDSAMPFDQSEPNTRPDDAAGAAGALAQPAMQTSGGQSTTNLMPAPSAPTATAPTNVGGDLASPLPAPHQQPSQQQQTSVTEPNPLASGSVIGGGTLTNTDIAGGPADSSGTFNDATFDDFSDMVEGGEGGEGGGLIDFEGGDGMGMDDSAFGDALHGMEQPEGGEDA